MGAERRGSSCVRAKEASGERGDGSRDLPTPTEPEKETRVMLIDQNEKRKKQWNRSKKFKAKMVRYADDFVILCHKGNAEPLMESLKKWLEGRGLKLNEEKTRIIEYGKESLDFLGFRIQQRKNPKTGKNYPLCEPSPSSCRKIREAIREETSWDKQWKKEEEVIETAKVAESRNGSRDIKQNRLSLDSILNHLKITL